MKALIPGFLLLTTALTATAQTPIVLTQNNFPALPTTVERYVEVEDTEDVAVPTLGANQTWDYSNLGPGAAVTIPYRAPGTTPAFAGTTREYAYGLSLGPIDVEAVSSEAYTATGLQNLGFRLPKQGFGLQAVTGARTDSLTIPAQTVTINAPLFTFPTTVGTINRQRYRVQSNGLLTIGLAGLNRTPLTLVQRVSSTDSVAGWGTVRIPTPNGPSTAIPVLLMKRYYTEVDSFYLGGQPAPAILLAALEVEQGTVIRLNRYSFYRANSAQSLVDLYCNDDFTGVGLAYYSAEASVLTSVKNALAARLGGLTAYPTPLRDGGLTLAAGSGEQLPVALRVYDALGRLRATAPARTGTPTRIFDGLPAGMYLLEAESAAGTRSTLRITRE